MTTTETCFKCGREAVEDGVCARRWDALSAHRDIREAVNLIVGAMERIDNPPLHRRFQAVLDDLMRCDSELVATP